MVRSSWSIARSTANSHTPNAVPNMPPASSISPSARSMAFFRQYEIAPDADDAAMCVVTEATATAGVMPMKISSGVIRNPPPMPNMPEMNPIASPMVSTTKMLTGMSAMGR